MARRANGGFVHSECDIIGVIREIDFGPSGLIVGLRCRKVVERDDRIDR